MSETATTTETADTAATTTADTKGAADTKATTATTTTVDTATTESLLAKPGAKADDKAATTTTDELAWLPEKYRVMDADGKLDLAASSKKLGEGYGNLSKKLGTGEAAPETPDAYVFTPPEQFKDIPLDEGLSKSFRERAHKAGLNQQQFEFVMGEYFTLVPQVLNAAASHTAAEAKAALSEVWKSPAELDAGVAAANRALAAAPEGARDAAFEKFGRDPDFIQIMAAFGKEMREDTTPSNATTQTVEDIGSLVSSEAYRDPKHKDHASVSAKVKSHFEAKFGNQPVLR
jgi:hypothetical protein